MSLGSEHFVVDFYTDRHTISPVKDIVVLEALTIKQIMEDPAVVHHLYLILDRATRPVKWMHVRDPAVDSLDLFKEQDIGHTQ